MRAPRTLDTTLRLQTLDDLFERPDLSPLSADYRHHSGEPALEYLADEIYANSSYRHLTVTFEVPEPALAGHDEPSVKAGIERWAAAKQQRMDNDVAATEWRGVRTLLAGIVMFAALIALSRLMDSIDGDVADTIRRGLEVGAWVILWFPLDLLIFERWQHRLDRRAYRLLGEMDITLRPLPTDQDQPGASAD